MAERDLTGNPGQADEPERPRGVGRAEADLDEILRLMDLHGVPGEETGEVSQRDPPEPHGPHGPRKRPLHTGPDVIDDVRDRRGGAPPPPPPPPPPRAGPPRAPPPGTTTRRAQDH